MLAIATSIDALAVGISLAFLNTDIWFASILIGVVTFAIAAFGGLAGLSWELWPARELTWLAAWC